MLAHLHLLFGLVAIALSSPTDLGVTRTRNIAARDVCADASQPQQTDGNSKGSGQCNSLVVGVCDAAWLMYEDAKVYTAYTSYVSQNGWGASDGCAAMLTCDDYGVNMTGAQVKRAVMTLKDTYGVQRCGSTYLDNGCHITLNYCTSCKATQ